MQVITWNGRVETEIEFNKITNVFMHKAYGQSGGSLPVNIEVETLVINLATGETVRFDISQINHSDELVALVKSK